MVFLTVDLLLAMYIMQMMIVQVQSCRWMLSYYISHVYCVYHSYRYIVYSVAPHPDCAKQKYVSNTLHFN